MKEFTFNDIKFRLGENAKENHLLIDESDPEDWWVHLDNLSSGHCIVECDDLKKDLCLYAAQLIKDHSKYRHYKKLKVIYLQIKNIRKTKNPGQVTLLKNPDCLTI
jgi:predicted ribosome quality control (RQC) complex YloA/Tae2 family protein